VTVVLDASAVLALLYREPGHEIVAELLDGAVISAVNWSEVLTKLTQRGLTDRAPAEALLALGVDVLPFNEGDAQRAANLWPIGRAAGLSLGDRACLALAQDELGRTAVTADKIWAKLSIPNVTVQLIR
jgi:ribonuclease VapC